MRERAVNERAVQHIITCNNASHTVHLNCKNNIESVPEHRVAPPQRLQTSAESRGIDLATHFAAAERDVAVG